MALYVGVGADAVDDSADLKGVHLLRSPEPIRHFNPTGRLSQGGDSPCDDFTPALGQELIQPLGGHGCESMATHIPVRLQMAQKSTLLICWQRLPELRRVRAQFVEGIAPVSPLFGQRFQVLAQGPGVGPNCGWQTTQILGECTWLGRGRR